MQCAHPFTITDKITKKTMKVACGHCMLCRKSTAADWTLRLLAELNYAKSGYFITLTYADEYLPYNMNLNPDDLKNFWKRVRKNKFVEKDEELKYYACGEYGDALQGQVPRPHYHAIVFNMKLDHSKLYREIDVDGTEHIRSAEIDKLWKMGKNEVGAAERRSMNYVTGYIRKKLNGEKAKEEYGENMPPFSRISKGIGKRYVEEFKDVLLEQGYIIMDNGKRRSIPRTWFKWLSIENRERVEILKEVQKINREFLNIDEGLAYIKYIKQKLPENVSGRLLLHYGEKGRLRRDTLTELELMSKDMKRKNL